MDLPELSNDQRRQLVDAKQAFASWRDADREFRHSFKGTMRWIKVGTTEYLYHIQSSVRRSKGPRSAATEHIKTSYMEQRASARQRRNRLNERLKRMDRVNRAVGLGRMPTTAASVLRKLDEAGLLGRQIQLVGTHSLYAFESRAGVQFEGGLTTTTDLDLLYDARQHMSLAIAENVKPEGILGLLRQVDRSFRKTSTFQATNDDGYSVDLIAPLRPDEGGKPPLRLGEGNDDLEAAAILGLQWLINAPKFEEIILADDGRPLWVSCIDPRAFALHKWWVSKQDSRAPVKRRRDAAQAKAVASLAADYLNMKFAAKDLTALPLQFVQCAKELLAATHEEARRPMKRAAARR